MIGWVPSAALGSVGTTLVQGQRIGEKALAGDPPVLFEFIGQCVGLLLVRPGPVASTTPALRPALRIIFRVLADGKAGAFAYDVLS